MYETNETCIDFLPDAFAILKKKIIKFFDKQN